jgi:CRP-like cAMP-binding protein
MIGISRETLSKIMEQLEQQRLLVHKSKKTIIINLLGLQKLSIV